MKSNRNWQVELRFKASSPPSSLKPISNDSSTRFESFPTRKSVPLFFIVCSLRKLAPRGEPGQRLPPFNARAAHPAAPRGLSPEQANGAFRRRNRSEFFIIIIEFFIEFFIELASQRPPQPASLDRLPRRCLLPRLRPSRDPRGADPRGFSP